MKPIACIALTLPLLAACVSIELPGVVSDTAKVAKDTYKSVTARKTPPAPEPAKPVPVAEAGSSIANTYVGQDNQTPTEVKQLCVSEAAAKLFKVNGREVGYSVVENTLSTVNNAVVATCRITANKPAAAASASSI